MEKCKGTDLFDPKDKRRVENPEGCVEGIRGVFEEEMREELFPRSVAGGLLLETMKRVNEWGWN